MAEQKNQQTTENVIIRDQLSPHKKNNSKPALESLPTPFNQYSHSMQEVVDKPISNQSNLKNLSPVPTMSQSIIIDVKQIQLQNIFQIRVSYFLSIFLKSFQFSGTNGIPYICNKVDHLPYSRFEINQNIQNGKKYILTSNFTGSKYNLTVDGESRFTIVFDVSCGASSPSRKFQLFGLGEQIEFSRLQGHEKQNDLAVLYDIGQNYNKILKFSSTQPRMSTEKGFLALKLSRQQVIPSVENSSIIDKDRTKVMEFYKINQQEQVFQVRFSNKIQVRWSCAFALASLDFKLALE